MKKLIALLVSSLMVFMLAGCNASQPNSIAPSDTIPTDSAAPNSSEVIPPASEEITNVGIGNVATPNPYGGFYGSGDDSEYSSYDDGDDNSVYGGYYGNEVDSDYEENVVISETPNPYGGYYGSGNSSEYGEY